MSGKGLDRKVLLRLGIALALLPLLGIATLGVLVATASKEDHFRFTRVHLPFASGVFPLYSVDHTGYFTDEYRIYSWQEGYDEVMRSADSELTAKGYVKAPSKGHSWVSWHGPDGRFVFLQPGRSTSRKDAFDGKPKPIDGWVTVITGEPVPDTWVSHIRYALEPSNSY